MIAELIPKIVTMQQQLVEWHCATQNAAHVDAEETAARRGYAQFIAAQSPHAINYFTDMQRALLAGIACLVDAANDS